MYITIIYRKEYVIKSLTNWRNASHYCYLLIPRGSQHQILLKVRNPASSLYNFISGRSQPSTKNQISYLNDLSSEARNIFPATFLLNGFLCMQYMSEYLQGDKTLLSIQERKETFSQVTEKLRLLHREGFVHGDIKLKNILIHKSSGHVVLIDIDYLEPVNDINMKYEEKQQTQLMKALNLSTNEK